MSNLVRANASCSYLVYQKDGEARRKPTAQSRASHGKVQARECCPPKAEVVSSNLAGSANNFNNLESAAFLSV